MVSGTERLLELQRKKLVEGDIWVNWQADEPFLCKEMIENLLQSIDDPFADVWTLKEKIYTEDQIIDPNICKVVCDQNGYALYFSRSPIPYRRDKKDILIFRHVGLYAYTQSALQRMQSMKSCAIEEAESLEQLRFLFGGLKIQVHETEYSSLGIDLPGHLILAEEYIKKMSPFGF
jgi:3-deoxy-manno-octulosonate cytidylyltransferase (CMP-KDO synthetase)